MQIPVIKEPEELQLIGETRNIEHAEQWECRGSDFVVDNPAGVTKKHTLIIAAHGIIAAQRKFFARQKSVCGILSPAAEDPRKIPRQSGNTFSVQAAVEVMRFGIGSERVKSATVIARTQSAWTVVEL